MRFIKAFGLAAFAALAAMAFVGASSASAQEHEIVLCKELVELCPAGKLWPAKTAVYALAQNPQLLSSFGTTTSCEDSLVTGLSETEFGSVANGLKFDETTVSFGVLDGGPKLGLGCTGSCTSAGVETIHAKFEDVRILVEAKDKYFLLGKGLAGLLKCPFSTQCAYRAEHVKVPITHTGKHPTHPGTENLPLVKFEVILNRVLEHEGVKYNGFPCPASATWHAIYSLPRAEFKNAKGEIESGLAWPSLDKPA